MQSAIRRYSSRIKAAILCQRPSERLWVPGDAGELYPPYSLNDKVESVQRTGLTEFWAAADLDQPAIASRFAVWQQFYNVDRPHISLGHRPPAVRPQHLHDKTPELDVMAWQRYKILILSAY